MKAIIKVVTAEDEFSEEAIKFMKRMAYVLMEHHNLSVSIIMKVKKVKKLKLKVS